MHGFGKLVLQEGEDCLTEHCAHSDLDKVDDLVIFEPIDLDGNLVGLDEMLTDEARSEEELMKADNESEPVEVDSAVAPTEGELEFDQAETESDQSETETNRTHTEPEQAETETLQAETEIKQAEMDMNSAEQEAIRPEDGEEEEDAASMRGGEVNLPHFEEELSNQIEPLAS